MRSRTQVDVSRADLETVIRQVVGSASPVTRVRELTDGMFNVAYAVRTADGRDVVVKVAPPDDAPVLTYERDLMRAEVDFFHRAQGVVPVPAVLGVDLSRSHLDRDVLVLEHLRGRPLSAVRRGMPAADRATVQRELGGLVARLRTVTGTRFGYDRPGGALSAATWPQALHAMVTAVLDDADRFGVRLPPRVASLPDHLAAAGPELAAVREPVLTHFDLWAGNVFVVAAGGGHHLEAVVDGERAFWGDPLAELASTALFRAPARATDFLSGYADVAGAPLDLGAEAQLRLALYRAYLYLVMSVEGAPRGYRSAAARLTGAYARHRLAGEIRVLDGALR